MNLQQTDNSIAHHSWWMLLHYLVKKLLSIFNVSWIKAGQCFEDSFNKTRQNNIIFFRTRCLYIIIYFVRLTSYYIISIISYSSSDLRSQCSFYAA